MESYLYFIGYLSPLEYVSITSKSLYDCITLESYCMDDIIPLWQKDHSIVIRNIHYYEEKDTYYILSDHKLPYIILSGYFIHNNKHLYSLYYSVFEWRLSHMLLKKEKEFYDLAIQTKYPCHYEWMWNWMEANPIDYPLFENTKQIMMNEIERCYQPDGKGFHWSQYNFELRQQLFLHRS